MEREREAAAHFVFVISLRIHVGTFWSASRNKGILFLRRIRDRCQLFRLSDLKALDFSDNFFATFFFRNVFLSLSLSFFFSFLVRKFLHGEWIRLNGTHTHVRIFRVIRQKATANSSLPVINRDRVARRLALSLIISRRAFIFSTRGN